MSAGAPSSSMPRSRKPAQLGRQRRRAASAPPRGDSISCSRTTCDQRLGRVAAAVRNLVWAPPSDTPNSMYGSSTISVRCSIVGVGRAGVELGREIRRPPRCRAWRRPECLPGRVADVAPACQSSHCLFSSSLGPTTTIVGDRAGRGDRQVGRAAPARRAGSASLASRSVARAGGGLAPGLGVVEQVPVLEGEGEAGVGGQRPARTRGCPRSRQPSSHSSVPRWMCGPVVERPATTL